MDWPYASLGDGNCDLACMTPSCNFDTAPVDIGLEESPVDYFERSSDCRQIWLDTEWPSGAPGDNFCD